MFTTGSKLLIGSAFAAALFAFVYGVTQEGSLGTIGLISAAVGLALLAAINVFVRDSNVSAMDPEAFEASAAARNSARASLWPLLTALGATTVTLGLITNRTFFILGMAAITAGGLGWLVQAWSERASADRSLQQACPQHADRPDRAADRGRDRRRHPDLLVQPHHARPADEDGDDRRLRRDGRDRAVRRSDRRAQARRLAHSDDRHVRARRRGADRGRRLRRAATASARRIRTTRPATSPRRTSAGRRRPRPTISPASRWRARRTSPPS